MRNQLFFMGKSRIMSRIASGSYEILWPYPRIYIAKLEFCDIIRIIKIFK